MTAITRNGLHASRLCGMILAIALGVSNCASPCPSDISPFICGDNNVNVSDLLIVITSWGDCLDGDSCGPVPARTGGQLELPPQNLNDCWDKCSNAFSFGSQEWADCFEACAQALEELQSSSGSGGS